MLRIQKDTPGVLDLSAVKDEFGNPVTLNGASYRDIPDHEENNPVLQRVIAMGWITAAAAPITHQYAVSEAQAGGDTTENRPTEPVSVGGESTGNPEAVESPPTGTIGDESSMSDDGEPPEASTGPTARAEEFTRQGARKGRRS